MKTITDNSKISKSELADIPKITHKLADKTLEHLEKDGIFIFPGILKNSEDLTGDQVVLQSINDVYRTGNIMGFLGCDQERLTITSRFSQGEDDFFLYYLLERVLHYPNIFDMEINGNRNESILDLLMFLFPSFLKKAMRKGLFKTYIRVQYNDCYPKGIIDTSRHIKQNTPFTGKISYNRREYSYDNYLVELIRHTIEFIKQKPHGDQLLYWANDEVKTIIEATPAYKLHNRTKIMAENQNNVMRHAYFHEYRILQQLCLLILQNQKQTVGTNGRRMYGILFDGAWLWEEFVNTLVSDLFHHPMNKAHKDAQWLFTGKKRVAGKIYPDFIGKGKYKNLIADAKYKPMNNIQSHDYLQVLAYMFRFDANKGFYFYPETREEEEVLLKLNSGSSYTKVIPRDDVCLIKQGLLIPQTARNYQEFCKKMKCTEEKFKNMLLASL